MTANYNIWWILLLIMSSFSIIKSDNLELNTNHIIEKSEDFFNATAQNVDQRNIIDELNSLKSINLSKKHGFFRSYLLAENSDNITLFEQQNFGFHQFDYNLNLINKFGLKGRGPGEIVHPMDLTVDKTGNYLILDGGSYRISKWSSEGILLEEFASPHGLIPHRFRVLDNQSFVLFSLMSQNSFHVFNKKGDQKESFLRVAGVSGNKKGFMLDGKIDTIPDENIIYYVGTLNSMLKAYTSEGELLFSRKIIKPLDLDFINMDDHEIRSSSFVTNGFTIYKDKLLILQNGKANDKFEKRYLDIYNRNNGDYSHTYILENKTVRIATNNNISNPLWIFLGLDEKNEEMFLSIYESPF
ncbi:MAG: hypothetical protein ACFCU6_00690 [Balneolaceae bacterium]